MGLDLHKTSDKVKQQPKPQGKPTVIHIETNMKVKPCCPMCKNEDFEGFGTSFGPMRRCRSCGHEWGGGYAIMLTMSNNEKDALKNFNASMQDEALIRQVSMQEDNERIEEIKFEERTSGHNRDFWNNYLNTWEDDWNN